MKNYLYCVVVAFIFSCGVVSLSSSHADAKTKKEASEVAQKKVAATAYNLSDANWTKGISNLDNNAFFVDKASSLANVKVGSILIFAKTGKHKVVFLDRNGTFVNIFVDGTKLDSHGDGYPNPISIAK